MYLGSQVIVKSGAIFSTIGVALLIFFIIVLLAFPVLKECQNSSKKCEFSSTAPKPLKFIVQPAMLVAALLTIATGVAIVRLGTWYHDKDTRKDVND
jgi:TRAP-type mannitol/chloroaromatic compound transport system permease small subunit